MPRHPPLIAATMLVTLLSAGCDMLGDSSEKLAAAKEAEGRAIGSACRHAARALEDCYALNKKADKAAVFAGWRDMNDYMRENKIEPVTPQVVSPPRGGKGSSEKAAFEKDEKEEKVETRPQAPSPPPSEAQVQIEKKPAQATPKPRGDHE